VIASVRVRESPAARAAATPQQKRAVGHRRSSNVSGGISRDLATVFVGLPREAVFWQFNPGRGVGGIVYYDQLIFSISGQ
jgi:hypothetical protein